MCLIWDLSWEAGGESDLVCDLSWAVRGRGGSFWCTQYSIVLINRFMQYIFIK